MIETMLQSIWLLLAGNGLHIMIEIRPEVVKQDTLRYTIRKN